MALKDILVCLDPTDAGESRLRLAAAIARQHGAHLSAACLLPEVIPGAAIPGATPYDGLGGAPPTGTAWMPRPGAAGQPIPGAAVDTARGAAVADIVEQRFREEVQPHALAGDWHVFGPGDSGDLLALLPMADLVVFGQTAPDYRLPTGFRADDMIVGGGRPTLVVPYAGRFDAIGRRVLIAWDGSREASRALHGALPLLGEAAAATVMTVRNDEAGLERDGPDLARLTRHLARHGIAARVEATLRGDMPVADLLLSRASDLAVDLIVAGGYHHSQLREALLGGVSRDLLDHMTVPVLMSH